MNSKPILFSAPMVRAILDGRKTQTRRVVKPCKDHYTGCNLAPCEIAGEINGERYENSKYILGDQLWVREAWRVIDVANCFAPREITAAHRIWYEADAPHQPGFGKYRPPMFMPRWASRITLEITDVRVERLQDISEADAIAEGVDAGKYSGLERAAARTYSDLWESINGPGSWDANPWVWVVEFKRVNP